jgi:hypothetical protein
MKASTLLSWGFTAIVQLLDAYSQDVKCLYSVDWGRLLNGLLSSCVGSEDQDEVSDVAEIKYISGSEMLN